MTLSESENVSDLDTLGEFGAKIDVAASTSLSSAAHGVQCQNLARISTLTQHRVTQDELCLWDQS